MGTYPSTLLWETFTASAAISSSTGAAVLLPTLFRKKQTNHSQTWTNRCHSKHKMA